MLGTQVTQAIKIMKNIIAITSLIAAGTILVNAKTNPAIDTTDSALKAYFNFDSGNSMTAGTISSWEDLPTWNPAGYGECTTTTAHPYTESAGLKATTGFTVSFDTNNISSNGTILSMTTFAMSLANYSISISYTNGTLSAKFHGNPNGAVSTTISSAVNTSDWTTLTLVGTAAASNTLVLDFYLNGALVGTSSTSGAKNIVSETINKLRFGYYGDNSNSASMNIDNILIYNRALSADEVKALVVVPEPSAFGLLAGAGALAFVAARRRRRAK